MQLNLSLQNTRGARLAALLLSLVLSAPALRALEMTHVPAISAPPAYPDRSHTPNDCHLSTLTFLARFQAEFPQERGDAVVVAMHNEAGVRWNHTVALISWHGQTWCRDEYLGVFALDFSFEHRPAAGRLATAVQSALDRQARQVLRQTGSNLLVAPPETLSDRERADDVTAAAHAVPFAVTIFWIQSGKQQVPVAFFRPNSRQIAVYEPLHGTCLAECASRDDAKIVALVATKLGYRADNVRADLPTQSALVASVDSTR
jgi:hypothetical protein